ncbi:helix-turn-helix domain-containing protein [Pseudomonas putida]|uniref:helix-turn-helix domain-containing protein n=1 Tax=Pseudomonas putida TaxID=303 RepID=UPI00352A0D63
MHRPSSGGRALQNLRQNVPQLANAFAVHRIEVGQVYRQVDHLPAWSVRIAVVQVEHTCGNVSQAARLMGLSRAQMMYRVDKLKQ